MALIIGFNLGQPFGSAFKTTEDLFYQVCEQIIKPNEEISNGEGHHDLVHHHQLAN